MPQPLRCYASCLCASARVKARTCRSCPQLLLTSPGHTHPCTLPPTHLHYKALASLTARRVHLLQLLLPPTHNTHPPPLFKPTRSNPTSLYPPPPIPGLTSSTARRASPTPLHPPNKHTLNAAQPHPSFNPHPFTSGLTLSTARRASRNGTSCSPPGAGRRRWCHTWAPPATSYPGSSCRCASTC